MAQPAPAVPRGITIRDYADGQRIQIAFSYHGKQCREMLPPDKITRAYIDYAIGLRAEIKRKIHANTFVYAEYFPNSPHAGSDQASIKPLTIGDLLRKQLGIYEKQAEVGNLSGSTLLGYSKVIKNELLPKFGKTALNRLTPSDLRAWISEMGTTAKTVRNRITPLRSALDDAVNDELIETNPLDRIALKKLLKQTSKPSEYEVDPFDHAEIQALLKACRADERPLVQFMFATGLRPGELIALSWGAVDFVHNRIRISDNEVTGMQEGRVVRIMKTPKTDAGIRDVDLDENALSAIRYQKGLTFLNGGRVWSNPATGEPWTTESQIRKTLWMPLLKRAGVRYRRPYQTRHTFASTLLTNGANPFWVASQLGHRDTEMVFRVYGKFLPSNYRQNHQEFGNSSNPIHTKFTQEA